MLNVTLTEEQVVSLIEQLPKEKRKQVLEQLLFDEWLDSPEGQKLMRERENDFQEGKTLTLEEMRKKLKLDG